GSGVISTSAWCARSTDCGPHNSWARTSSSFWAGSRIHQAAGLVQRSALLARRPVPVQRVRLVQVAVRVARPPQILQLEVAELVPGLRVLRLEVARLAIELQRLLRRLEGCLEQQRVDRERV